MHITATLLAILSLVGPSLSWADDYLSEGSGPMSACKFLEKVRNEPAVGQENFLSTMDQLQDSYEFCNGPVDKFGMWCEGNVYGIPQGTGLLCRFVYNIEGDRKDDQNVPHKVFVRISGEALLYTLPNFIFDLNWKFQVLKIDEPRITYPKENSLPPPPGTGAMSTAGGRKENPAEIKQSNP